MRIDPRTACRAPALQRMLLQVILGSTLLASSCVSLAAEEAAGPGSDWKSWRAHNDLNNVDSLQRGARNFFNYCVGCHSLKYERYSRLGEDLKIPPQLLAKDILQPGDKPTQYILTSMPATDAEVWFGKVPPDLSLVARARGVDYLYQYLKTFYFDPSRQTGANNLRLPNTAMPDVVSSIEGVKAPVYKAVRTRGADGKVATEQVFDHFQSVAPGRMNAEEFDTFVRDTVNFLDYVGEPTQVARHALGVWVVLFLLAFTWLAWLLKKEYWKDVH